MKRELFTVEGNTWQKKAFVEQLEAEGFRRSGNHHLDDGVYLKPHKDKSEGKVIGYQEDSYPIHFILPQDWDVAIEAFRDYYKEEELIVGKWYTVESGVIKYSHSKPQDRWPNESFIDHCYTVAYLSGIWVENSYVNGCKLKPATKEEIQTALENEAKKRGFKEGAAFDISVIDEIYTKNGVAENNEFIYYPERDVLRLDGYIIYKDGKWAELLPSTPDITINGYKAEFKVDRVKFGCQEFHKKGIAALNSALEHFNSGDYKLNGFQFGVIFVKSEWIEEINNYFTSQQNGKSN